MCVVGTALGKLPAAFAAAVIIVCGVLYVPRHHFYFNGKAYGEFFERLPVTVELIVASVVLALILAAICTLLARRRMVWLGAILAAVLFIFMCLPAFWLALVGQFVFAVHGVHIFGHFFKLPTAGLEQPDSFVLPTALLALFQAGAYVDAMRSGISAKRLFAAFAWLLPAILSADVVVEIIFAWPGVGRAFYIAQYEHTSYIAALLVISSAAVIIVRTIASIVSPERDVESSEVLQPL